MLLTVTIFIGIFLRLTHIIKVEGLWNDEYVSWMVSATPFNQGFWASVFKQCHMPLYYLYLKPFSQFDDTILRLTSLVPSVISIYIIYLVGKEHSKKSGIFAASITSILSFLVYYAQEVRFYSILFLFSAILLLFTLKLIKKMTKKNTIGFVVSSLLVILTHVLGIIFVFFNILYVLYKKKTFSKVTFLSGILVCLFLTPFFINILNQIHSAQWWGKFSYTNILFLFSDYLSPILTNNVNAPPIFFYNPSLAFWLVVPTLIGLFGIMFGIKNNKGIIIVSLLYIIVLSILAKFGIIVFITKYSIEILPTLILLMAIGYSRLNKTGLILFTFFILIHLACIFTPYYVTKTIRSEGHQIVGEILNQRQPDNVIFTYYAPDRFSRYYKGTGKQYYISKLNRKIYKKDPALIFSNIKKGETVSVVFLNSVSFLPEDYLQKHKSQLPEMFCTFSHIRNVLIDELEKNFTILYKDSVGSWTVITAR